MCKFYSEYDSVRGQILASIFFVLRTKNLTENSLQKLTPTFMLKRKKEKNLIFLMH